MMFGPAVDQAAMADALERYPREACGFVSGGVYHALENVHEDPENNFEIQADKWLEYTPVQAVIHSHADERAFTRDIPPGVGLDAPSKSDMESQIATAVPWGILLTNGNEAAAPFWFGDHTLDDPLKQRVFRHGVHDCYALLRAYYWQERGIKLPDFPRVDGWWDKGYNLFLENFEAAGFRRLGPDEPRQRGDVALAAVSRHKDPVVNHCGIYLGNGKILHHLYNRLSREDPITPYMRFVHHWVRYEP